MYTQSQINAFHFAIQVLCQHSQDQIALDTLLEEILKRVNQLEPRDREIVLHYWGLDNKPPKSTKGLARVFNLSEDRVRSIIYRATDKLGKGDITACVLRAILAPMANQINSLHCKLSVMAYDMDNLTRLLSRLRDFTNELKSAEAIRQRIEEG